MCAVLQSPVHNHCTEQLDATFGDSVTHDQDWHQHHGCTTGHLCALSRHYRYWTVSTYHHTTPLLEGSFALHVLDLLISQH